MHAIVITSPGGPDVLKWAEVPDPEPGPGEVLIDIAASAVNRADLLQRQGFYPPPAGAPPYPGLECSGRIAAAGPGVTGWRAGDEVCALLAGGGYARAGRGACRAGAAGARRAGGRPTPRLCLRLRAPSGPMCSSLAGWRPGRLSLCTAARAASARSRCNSPGHAAHGCFAPLARRRNWPDARNSAHTGRSPTGTRTSPRWSGISPAAAART